MPAPSSLIHALGDLLAHLRESPAVDTPHGDAARRVVAALDGTPLTISADGFGLTVSDHQLTVGSPGAEEVLAAMQRHLVGRIELAATVSVPAVLALARGLADAAPDTPSADALLARLGLPSAGPVRLHGPRALPKASDTITLDQLDAPDPEAGTTDAFDPFPDLDTRLPAPGSDPGSPPAPPLAAVERTPSPFLRLTLPEALARLEAAPDDGDAGMLLHHVTHLGRQLAERGQWEDLLATGGALLGAEERASPGVAKRYDAALRRLLTRPVLEALVPLVVTGPWRAAGFPVFRRGGADATDVLLDLLVRSEDMNERASAFRGLQEMTEGTGAIVHLLGHDQWYVLRNVAELCGLMGLEAAAPRLRGLLGHADERVRRAVAGAVARLPGADAADGVRAALRDLDPHVRLACAQGVGGPPSRGLAMTLAVLLAEEEHPDVLRELHLALGRIGTPEAVQVLGKAAEPGGVLRGRKPQSARLAAVEGLRVAGGPVAQRLLLALAADDDREVGAAASAAVDAMPG